MNFLCAIPHSIIAQLLYENLKQSLKMKQVLVSNLILKLHSESYCDDNKIYFSLHRNYKKKNNLRRRYNSWISVFNINCIKNC